MTKSNLSTAIVLLFLFCISTAQGQLGQFDNLQLDDGNQHSPTISLLAGNNNDANFRIVAFDSGLGFYRPGLSTSSVWLSSDMKSGTFAIYEEGVGIGTHPSVGISAPLHVYGDGTEDLFTPYAHPWVFVEDRSTTIAHRVLMLLSNNGGSSLRMENTSNGRAWETSVLVNGDYRISLDGSGGHEFRIARNGRVLMGPGNKTVFNLAPNGNLVISGSLSQSSDRNKKENFKEVDRQQILDKLMQLPVQSWNYKDDSDSTRHVGPMAQDFYKQFGLGENDVTISTVDTAGVTIAALQALNEKLELQIQNRDRQIANLANAVGLLTERIESLESLSK